MFRQEIGSEMIWQNDGRRSGPLVSWGAVREKEREKREECGTGRLENNRSLLTPSPSLLLSLAIFRVAHGAAPQVTTQARWTRDLLGVHVGRLAGVTVLCS